MVMGEEVFVDICSKCSGLSRSFVKFRSEAKFSGLYSAIKRKSLLINGGTF